MKLFFAGKLVVYSLIVVFLLLSSCSSYYWTTIDTADLEAGDSVYRVKTLSGDTYSFRNRRGSSGIFNGEEICGIDKNGDELTLGLTEVSELELAAWDPVVPYLVCGGLLVLIIYFVIELNSEGADQAS